MPELEFRPGDELKWALDTDANEEPYTLKRVEAQGKVLEVEDVQFHVNSVVLLPERSDFTGEYKRAEDPPAADRVTGLAVIKALIDHAAGSPDAVLLVAGHSDVTGDEEVNLSLSHLRAKCVQALLKGDASAWAKLCHHKSKTEDYQRIFKWAAAERSWDCDPGAVDDVRGSKTKAATRGFQRAYNMDFERSIATDGVVGEETWGAVFEVYMDALAKLTTLSVEAVKAKLGALEYLATGAIGCGEKYPIEGSRKGDYRSQKDRRVELLFFEADAAPKPRGGDGDRGLSAQIYTPGFTKFEPIACSPVPPPAPPTPTLTKVAWRPGPAEFGPTAAGVALEVQAKDLVKPLRVSQFEFALQGKTPDGAWEDLPLEVLGLPRSSGEPSDAADLSALELREGAVRGRDPSDDEPPALTLRIGWDAPTEDASPSIAFSSYKASVKLLDGEPAEALESDEVERMPFVAVFANPDGLSAGKRFCLSAGSVGAAVEEGGEHLAFLQRGWGMEKEGDALRQRGQGSHSAFEEGGWVYTIPAGDALKYMRGSEFFFYRGHGSLSTATGNSPCDSCELRQNWKDLDADAKRAALRKTSAPAWAPPSTVRQDRMSSSWETLEDELAELDDASGMTVYVTFDEGQLKEPLCIPKPTPDQMWKAAKEGDDANADGSYSLNVLDSVTFVIDETPPSTRRGGPLAADDATFEPVRRQRCRMSTTEDDTTFVEWKPCSGDGSEFESKLVFEPDALGADEVNGLEGTWPVPTKLVWAGGCLTAASDHLADAFLGKGSEHYIGNQILVWGSWSSKMLEEFATLVFVDGLTVGQAFEELKADYAPKLRCKLY